MPAFECVGWEQKKYNIITFKFLNLYSLVADFDRCDNIWCVALLGSMWQMESHIH